MATGVSADGRREVLGVDVGDSWGVPPLAGADEAFWRGSLTSLKNRGLTGVKLVISDQHVGLVAAITRTLQGSSHQRCRVHFIRNVLAPHPQGRGRDGHTQAGGTPSRGCSARYRPLPQGSGR